MKPFEGLDLKYLEMIILLERERVECKFDVKILVDCHEDWRVIRRCGCHGWILCHWWRGSVKIGAKHEGKRVSGEWRCSSEVSQALLQLNLSPKTNIEEREGGKWRLEGELREDEKFMLASLHMIKVQFSPRPFQIALTSNTNKVDDASCDKMFLIAIYIHLSNCDCWIEQHIPNC
jgi:hypothetical protein